MNPTKHSCAPANQPAAWARLSRYLGLIAVACSVSLQPACLFRRGHNKAKVPQAPAAAVRIALLPLNIPAENSDLRWISIAAPLVMSKMIENSASYEIVPVWQTYPVAIESLGAGRTITPEIAAYVASRVGAKWATHGELTSAKNGVWMRVDFIPAKATLVPYRFERESHLDAMGADVYEAFSQFTRYLVLSPLPRFEGKGLSASSMRELAMTLDREYGWFVTAEPGKSDKVVADLVQKDNIFARLLFDPILYPAIGPPAAKPKPVELKPAAVQTQEKPDTEATPPPAAPVPPPPPPPPTTQAPSATAEAPPAAPQTPQPAVSAEKAPIIEQPAAVPTPEPSSPPVTQTPAPPSRVIPRKAAPSASKPPARTPALRSGIPPGTAHRAEEATPGKAGGTSVTVEKKATPAPEDGTFQLQVYSTQQKEDADAKAAKLAKAGFSPKVDQVELPDKGMWYRIRLQGFKTREVAKAVGEKLVADKLINQYWIVP